MTMTQHARDLDHAVALIPDGVCVEAADNAVPHLTARTHVGLHGDIGDELATWMIAVSYTHLTLPTILLV